MTRVQLAVAVVGMGVAWFGVSTVFTTYDVPARIIPTRETVAQSSPSTTVSAKPTSPVATPTALLVIHSATDTPTATTTASATPTAAPTSTPTETPIPTATSTRTATPTATATPKPAPTATPVPRASPTPPPAPTQVPGEIIDRTGIAKAVGSSAVVVREQASTSSAERGSIPVGTRVEVLRVVRGEAIDPVEPRWFEVRYGDRVGYVYFKLIGLVD